MEAVKSMIHDQDYPCTYGPKQLQPQYMFKIMIAYNVLGNKTPEYMFTGENPEVNNLNIFGYLVFIHVPKEKRTKLDPSRNKRICVGYNDKSKSYRVYIPSFF